MATVEKTVPRIVNRLRRKSAKRLLPLHRQHSLGHRERVFYHYLNTLDAAKEEGLARTGTQTPYEYNRILEPKLTETSPEMMRLTEVFVEARYSKHPFNVEIVEQAAADAKSVQEALQYLKNNPDGHNEPDAK